jgi:hypothetical protein
MIIPPTTVNKANALPRNQSTIAMMNIVSLHQQHSGEGGREGYIAPTLDNTGDVNETMVRKLAVKPILLKILIPRNNAALPEGNSNVSRPVKCNIGIGIHIKQNVNRPIPVVHAFEKIIDLYGPMGAIGHALALYKTSYNPYNTAPQAIISSVSREVEGGTASPINRL